MADIPTQQLTEHSALDTVLRYLDDVVVWAARGPDDDAYPGFTYVSPGFETIWGRPRDAILANDDLLMESVHPADRDAVDAKLQDIDADDPDALPRIEHRVVRPDGDVRWVEARLFSAADDPDAPGDVVGITIDITRRKHAERDLVRQNAKLEEFADVVSHDLRNPLNVAQGHLDLAREAVDDPHLDAVARAHDRMETLIADLLALARDGVATSDREPVALDDLARSCWATVDTADAALTVDTDRTVSADPTQLRRVFENLFRNSVEHGGPTVTVTVTDYRDGFAVADDGPGLPDVDRDRLLDTGYSTSDAGTGFGLAIVAQIADAHGWTLSVAESEAGGARFEFTDVDDSA